MKKTIIAAAAAVVLLGVTLVGGAAVTGTQAKKRLQALPQTWQAQWPMVKVVEQRYERGLFSATQLVTLQFGCDSAAPAPGGAAFTLTLRQNVRHGPLPGFSNVGAAVIDTEVVLPEAARKAFAGLTDQPPLRAHTVVGLGGATHTHFEVPALKAGGAEGPQLVFDGLRGDIDDSGGTLRYDVAMPAFSVSMRDARMAMAMSLRGARLHGEIGSGGPLLWTRPAHGEGELAQLEMQVSPGAGAPANMPPVKLALRELRFSSASTLDKELLSSTARMAGQGEFNQVKLDKIELQASLARLHAPSYERLVQHVMDTSAAACGMARGISPQVVLSELQQDLAALLPYNPEYALDKLAIESGGQRAEFSYALGITGASEEDAKLPMPVLFLGKGHLRAEAMVPAAWVEQAMTRFGGAGADDPTAQAEMASVMLAKMSNDGFVVREGEMLRSRVSFDKGQMLVNGKPLARPPVQ